MTPDDALHVRTLMRSLSDDQLRMLRWAFDLDRDAAERRGDAPGAAFCAGRVAACDRELARRAAEPAS